MNSSVSVIIIIIIIIFLSIYHKGRRTQKAKPVQGVSLTINTLHKNTSKTHYIKTQSTIQKQKHNDEGTKNAGKILYCSPEECKVVYCFTGKLC